MDADATRASRGHGRGTGGHGHTFPGATVPFGMVQLSPDTNVPGSVQSPGQGYRSRFDHQDEQLFGGPDAFERKLDELFTTCSELPDDAPPDIAGLVGQYAHGNEPSHHVAYLYAYTGAHYRPPSFV
jgi:putative alpha-1,2-mannosidase